MANAPRRNSSAKAILNLAIIGIVVFALSFLAMAGMFLSLSDRYNHLQQDYNSLQYQSSSLQQNYTNSLQELATDRSINSYLQSQISNVTQKLDSLTMETAYCSYSVSISYDNLTLIFPPSSNINSSFSTINATIIGINLTRIGSESQVDKPWLVPASALRAIPEPAAGSGLNLMINTDAFRNSFYENDPPVWQAPIVQDYNISGYDMHNEIYNLTLTGLVQITYYQADNNITFYLDHGDGSPYGGFIVQIQ